MGVTAGDRHARIRNRYLLVGQVSVSIKLYAGQGMLEERTDFRAPHDLTMPFSVLYLGGRWMVMVDSI